MDIFYSLLKINLIIFYQKQNNYTKTIKTNRTGSLLIAIIMHFALTAVTISFMPVSGIGTSIFILQFALAAVMWIFAGVIILANRRQFLG